MSKNRGSRNGAAKLTEEDVKEIRQLRKQGYTVKELAGKFGVGYYTLRDLDRGINWGWLE